MNCHQLIEWPRPQSLKAFALFVAMVLLALASGIFIAIQPPGHLDGFLGLAP